MSLSATSRVPVEIWEPILRMVVTGMDVLNPDRYDVPAAKLLAVNPRIGPYDQYKDYMAQLLQPRLVCKDWDHFVHPFVDLVASVHRPPGTRNDQMDNIKRLSRAIRVVAFSLHPLCGCRFGALCETCRTLCVVGHDFVHYLYNKKGLSVKILEGLDEEELCTLIESCHFPSLEAITLHCDMWFLWPESKRATQCLSNLVFLSIRTTEDGFEVKMPLDFPRLKSLEFFVERGNGQRVRNWKLPLLTTLVLKLDTYVVEGMLDAIHDIAPNLKFLSLSHNCEFNAEEPSQIWSFFPHLIVLSCPMDFFLTHLPPPTHPLRYFMAVGVGRRILEKCGLARKAGRTAEF
jgi:hypothetical protein